jgi:hypothetical protein
MRGKEGENHPLLPHTLHSSAGNNKFFQQQKILDEDKKKI